ncbi:MAG TPA: DinB family protein [Saprospiraceae bacterium]|nr:DinB family protein [Saprospiraceae bacterium]HMP23391.1 DinB family protein [Saprospiraceae bacterium]
MNTIQGNQRMIEQIAQLLQRIDQEVYTQPLAIFNHSTVGQHFRHILDFYRCLLRGVAADKVDYADRDRDPRIEADPQYTGEVCQRIADALSMLSEMQAVEVVGDFSNQTDMERPLLRSSVGRELMFAHDHAVHHLAMIKIGLQYADPQLAMDAQLGVAPSTIKHRRAAGG